MKKLSLICFTLFSVLTYGQILEPVKWTFDSEKISENEYELKFIASIEDQWAIYSQFVDEGGPVPTMFEFEDNDAYTRIDKVVENEENKVTKQDPVFDMVVSKFYNKAVFTQKVKLNGKSATIKGQLSFMTCDNTRCLPPADETFEFNLGESKSNNAALGGNQILEPVKWTMTSTKVNDQEYDLTFKANIEKKWAVYSQFVEEGGPLPTRLVFDEADKGYELVGTTKELDDNKVTQHDPVFDMTVTKFYNQATFVQRVKVTSEAFTINGNLEYMTCDAEKCVFMPDNPFKFNYTNSGGLVLEGQAAETNVAVNNEDVNKQLYGMLPSELQAPESEIKKGNSLWKIFGLGFLGGLIALLTPCVFPMIPLTVSFFTKKGDQDKGSGVSKAVLYGFFILAVYLILSVPFHLLDSVNPDILNEISTNVWLNVIFFAIFLFFAFSFFGYYELTLPSSWTMKTTKGENVGGIVGIFFMALTLAIVSFSCTGPILGSLLAGSLSADGGAWQLTAGMAGFGVSLGLPFALFAMFPSMLNSLPKSGGWLNTVKVVLGFVELALAFKFLSNADLVKHWGILKIEVFLGLWIIIFAGLALYLFGKIKFPHDSPIKKLSFSRISLAVLIAAFTIYLASGFRVNKETNTFTSLTLLSGLAPPVGYSFLYPSDSPNALKSFKDLKEGITHAQKVGKPILLDFTGYACVNCRKMEEHVWPIEAIDKMIREEYVLISLYVDDKKELPTDEQHTVNRVNGGTRQLENYGHKWAHFQTEYFQINSQPYYVLLSSDGKQVLNRPVGYTPDQDEYAKFLQEGLDAFKNK
ncbi:MAG: thioredoxin fold domain-containing protein [Flavobacteriaceae bacterium]|nr:thioredoxin fold domain-containing protein [Flavobacteriaceae bacterium]